MKSQLSKPASGHQGATVEDLRGICQVLVANAAEIGIATNYEDTIEVARQFGRLLPSLIADANEIGKSDEFLKKDFDSYARNFGDSLCRLVHAHASTPPGDTPEASQKALKTHLDKVTKDCEALNGLIKRLPQEVTGSDTNENSTDIEEKTENELLRCAAMINDAVKLLTTIEKNQKRAANVGISTADISEAILEAARAIGMATGDLIQCSVVVQGERKEAAHSSSKYNPDPAWANGLISAAQGVTKNVRTLVQAANGCAKGEAEEERLVAAAKAVAVATIQLTTASRTKAMDPTASSQKNLSKASNNVSKSTNQLVLAAQAAQEFKDQGNQVDDFSNLDFSAASGIRAQMEQSNKIDKVEKELRDAHQELIKLRRARYQAK